MKSSSSDPTPPTDPNINRAVGLLLTVIILILMILLAEGAVRFRQWMLYGSFFHLGSVLEETSDERLKKTPKPGFETRTVKINSLGFRGPELASPKPKGMLRVAFLGGSTTYCAEVSGNHMTWPHLVLERLRKAYPDQPMDYVNGGVSGYTTYASLANFEQRIAPLHPDLVMVYHASNDLSVETRELAMSRGLYDPEEKPDQPSWLGEYSLLWFLAELNFRVLRLQHKAGQGGERLNALPDWLDDSFEKRVVRLLREAQGAGAMAAVATWSQRTRPDHSLEEKLKGSASALFHMPFMTPDGLIEGYKMFNGAIRRAAKTTDALLIGNENAIPGDGEHFNDSVHFTDQGSAAMAKRVADALLASPEFQALVKQKGRERAAE